MNKKVGVITFHFADNFGAVLQVYALSNKIKKMGMEAEIIDFSPLDLKTPYLLFPNYKIMLFKKGLKYTINNILARIYYFKHNYLKIKNFEKFRKEYLNLTDKRYTNALELKNLKEKYDYCITGSDQVWNPKFFSQSGGAYFLDFADDTTKKISYAASIAEKVDERYYEEYRKHLSNFEKISVREDSAKKFLESITNKKINVTLDPTLLLDKSEWNEIASFNRNNDRYILVYDLIKDPLVTKLANKISKETNLKIISYSKRGMYNNWDNTFSACNPTEFLGLFSNAELVITNSFHGTAFAINYNKLFYTVPHPERGSRMIDLMSNLDLQDQLIRTDQDIDNLNKEINYDVVNDKLKKMRKDSLEFLQLSLGIKK